MEENPSPISHGREIMNGKCRPVCHTLPPSPREPPLRTVQMIGRDKDSDDDSEFGESTDSDEE